MAKKNDRKEYNKLKKKKADNKKQQEQCQSEIDVLDEKIERLKAAYRKLDDAKEAIDDIKHNQRNMINSDLYQCMWTGSNAQECYDSCALLPVHMHRNVMIHVRAEIYIQLMTDMCQI